ncbi:hypothetical protein Hanom_Chr05g00402901 [Helianthus anomalus]
MNTIYYIHIEPVISPKINPTTLFLVQLFLYMLLLLFLLLDSHRFYGGGGGGDVGCCCCCCYSGSGIIIC